jgi:hypothetical protein
MKNILNNKVFSIVMLLIFIFLYTFLTNFYAINDFNSNVALLNTIEANNDSVVIITNYYEMSFVNYDGEPLGIGEVGFLFSVTESDESKIRESVPFEINLYPAYYFLKNLQDFSDNNIAAPTNPVESYFNAFGFTEAVIVSDFSTFNKEIRYGEKPSFDNEILIYDFMAHNLISQGIVEIKNVSDIPGTSIVDVNTGLELVISGVLASHFEKYRYIDDMEFYANIDFENSYLAGLQSIFGKTELLSLINQERNYYSIHELLFNELNEFYDYQILEIEHDIKKIIFTEELENINIIGDLNPEIFNTGIIISDLLLAELYDVSLEKITQEFINEKYTTLNPEILSSRINNSYECAATISTFIGFFGVYESCNYNEINTVLYWQNDEFEWFVKNGTFRQFYVSLTGNYNNDMEIINAFSFPERADDFYRQNPDFYNEDYVLYTPYLMIIRDASQFLESVKTIGGTFLTITCVVSVVCLCFFTVFSIRKNRYKIGILKTHGISNYVIILIFGLESLIILLSAFMCSILTSNLLIFHINNEFVKHLQYSVVFFDVKLHNFFVVFLISFPIIIISIIAALINLHLTSPLDIIRGSKKHL